MLQFQSSTSQIIHPAWQCPASCVDCRQTEFHYGYHHSARDTCHTHTHPSGLSWKPWHLHQQEADLILSHFGLRLTWTKLFLGPQFLPTAGTQTVLAWQLNTADETTGCCIARLACCPPESLLAHSSNPLFQRNMLTVIGNSIFSCPEQLQKSSCRSVGPSVGPSVRRSVRPSVRPSVRHLCEKVT